MLNPTREPAFITEVNHADGVIEKVKLVFVEDGFLYRYIVSKLEIVDLLSKNIHVRTLSGEPPDNLFSAKVIPYAPDKRHITTEYNETEKDNLGELPGIDCDTAVQIATVKDLNYLEDCLRKFTANYIDGVLESP